MTELNAKDLSALDRERTVFIFGVGGIEDFGPHLPLGLAMEKAQALAGLVAEKIESDLKGWTAIRMPPAPLGIDRVSHGLHLSVRPFVLRDYLVDSCRRLGKAGFRHFVCVTGTVTPRQLTAIEEAGKIVHRRFWLTHRGRAPRLLSLQSSLDKPKNWESPLWPDPMEHGGAIDTSIALWLRPERVSEAHAHLPAVERDPSFWQRFLQRWQRRSRRGDEVGRYWGDPAAATAEKGEQVLRAQVNAIWPKLRPVLEGASPRSEFRSWYSILPPNWSAFLLWSLFIIMLFGTTGLALYVAEYIMNFDI